MYVENLLFVVASLAGMLLCSVLKACMYLFRSKVEMLPSVSPPVHWRVQDADTHVRCICVNSPQPDPISGKRLSFVKKKSYERCSLFRMECFRGERKWLMSYSFGQACQEIFCSCISPKENTIARKVVIDLIHFINHVIYSVLMIVPVFKRIYLYYVDVLLCMHIMSVFSNFHLLP